MEGTYGNNRTVGAEAKINPGSLRMAVDGLHCTVVEVENRLANLEQALGLVPGPEGLAKPGDDKTSQTLVAENIGHEILRLRNVMFRLERLTGAV